MINRERLIKSFFELVQIDSPTGGEHQIAEYLTAKLRELGFQTRLDKLFNLTAFLPGQGAMTAPLLLGAHMDCGAPCHGIKPRVENGIIKSDGTTILGGDDRAGIAAILEALTVIHENAPSVPHPPIEIAPIVQHVSAAIKRSGREPEFGVTGGGSDANTFNARGIACVVVSTGVENIHTTSEFLPLEELVKAAELALEIAKAKE